MSASAIGRRAGPPRATMRDDSLQAGITGSTAHCEAVVFESVSAWRGHRRVLCEHRYGSNTPDRCSQSTQQSGWRNRPLPAAQGGGLGLALAEVVARVGLQAVVSVDMPRGPSDLDRFDPVAVAQPEVEPGVVGREVAAAADALGDLPVPPAVSETRAPTASRLELAVPSSRKVTKWPAGRSGCGSRPAARSGRRSPGRAGRRCRGRRRPGRGPGAAPPTPAPARRETSTSRPDGPALIEPGGHGEGEEGPVVVDMAVGGQPGRAGRRCRRRGTRCRSRAGIGWRSRGPMAARAVGEEAAGPGCW